MFDWKIISSIIAALVVFVSYLGTSPAVSGFFDTIGERFSSLAGDTTTRDIEFTLVADKYSDIRFSAKLPVNVTLNGYGEAVLKTGTLKMNKTLGIYEFRGSGSVIDNTLTLDGKMSKLELPEITASQDTIKLNSAFSSLSITNLAVKELKIVNTSGMLTVRGTSTQFTGNITIASPLGNFDFFVNNQTFALAGKAGKIQLSSGIVVE